MLKKLLIKVFNFILILIKKKIKIIKFKINNNVKLIRKKISIKKTLL